MGKTWMAVAVMAVSLQGCAGAVVYGESRKVSREVISPVAAAAYPGQDTEATTTCILKGMTVGEVLSLPNSRANTEAGAMRSMVQEVSTRPGVSDCLAAAPRAAG